MALEPAPAFQFFVKEWRSSRAVQRMRMQVRGMYLEMLVEEWENLTLPDDPRAVYELVGGPDPVEDWIAAWPELRRKFVDRRAKPRPGQVAVHDPSDWDVDRRIVNLKLEKIRKGLRDFRKERRASGREGGLAKARNTKHTRELEGKQNVAQLEPSASSALAKPTSASASAIASATASPSASATPTTIVRGATRLEPAPPDDLADRAGRLLEDYADLFQRHQRGARYHARPHFDLPKAVGLVETWTDDERLRKLATIVLTTDDTWIAKTDRGFGVFASKASWADAKLTAWETGQGAS